MKKFICLIFGHFWEIIQKYKNIPITWRCYRYKKEKWNTTPVSKDVYTSEEFERLSKNK